MAELPLHTAQGRIRAHLDGSAQVYADLGAVVPAKHGPVVHQRHPESLPCGGYGRTHAGNAASCDDQVV